MITKVKSHKRTRKNGVSVVRSHSRKSTKLKNRQLLINTPMANGKLPNSIAEARENSKLVQSDRMKPRKGKSRDRNLITPATINKRINRNYSGQHATKAPQVSINAVSSGKRMRKGKRYRGSY